MAETCSTHGKMTNVYNILVAKPEEMRPLVRLWSRWEDNIRMDLREVGWKGVKRMQLAQHRDLWQDLVNAVMNLRFP
jgi:hypothetical protein